MHVLTIFESLVAYISVNNHMNMVVSLAAELYLYVLEEEMCNWISNATRLVCSTQKSFTSGNSQAGVSVLFIPPLFLSKC